MKFSYENQGAKTLLVYQLKKEDTIDTLSLGMLTNNKIEGIAPLLFTQMDADKYFKCNISSKVPVKQFFSGIVNKKGLLGVFTGICTALQNTEDYMLELSTIILDIDYIYVDVSSYNPILICIPIIREKEKIMDLGAFLKKIMFSTQFDQTENCDYVATILNFLNSNPVFALDEFKKLLEDLASSLVKAPVVNKTPKVVEVGNKDIPASTPSVHKSTAGSGQAMPSQQRVVDSKKQANHPQQGANTASPNDSVTKERPDKKKAKKGLFGGKKTKKKVSSNKSQVDFAVPGIANPPVNNAVQPQASAPRAKVSDSGLSQPSTIGTSSQMGLRSSGAPEQSIKTGKANFGETTVLSAANNGETTVLNNAMEQSHKACPYLLRQGNNEKIPIDKPVFRIGKEKSYVDYFIGDNTAISRSHANIVRREESSFIVDTNSTNHTFVEEKMIPSNQEIELEHGAKIRLANEQFVFYLY